MQRLAVPLAKEVADLGFRRPWSADWSASLGEDLHDLISAAAAEADDAMVEVEIA